MSHDAYAMKVSPPLELHRSPVPIDSLIGRNSVLRKEWPLALVLAAILFMLLPMFQANFTVTDDHEIVSFFGPDHRVTFSEFFDLVRSRAFETNGRFRPGYYVLRIVETTLLGYNPVLWHANRVFLAFVCAFALYRLIRVALPPICAAVITFLFFSGPQNEIWVNLGAGETYGIVLVLSGLALAATAIERGERGVSFSLGLLLVALAGFVKESFIPMFPASVVFIFGVLPRFLPLHIRQRLRVKVSDLIVLALLTAGTGIQLWATIANLHAYGHIYSGQTAWASLARASGWMLARYSKDTLWFVPIAAALAACIPKRSTPLRRARGSHFIQTVILFAVATVLLLLPQSIVYGGSPYNAGRYLVPGNLFAVFVAAVGFYYLRCATDGERTRVVRGAVVALLLVIAVVGALRTFRVSMAEARASQQFQTRLSDIVRLKRAHPEAPLLFCSTKLLDREPLTSVATFLSAQLPGDRPYLRTFDWEAVAKSDLDRRLAMLLRHESLYGDRLFSGITQFTVRDGQCIGVIFSGSGDSCHCRYAVRMFE